MPCGVLTLTGSSSPVSNSRLSDVFLLLFIIFAGRHCECITRAASPLYGWVAPHRTRFTDPCWSPFSDSTTCTSLTSFKQPMHQHPNCTARKSSAKMSFFPSFSVQLLCFTTVGQYWFLILVQKSSFSCYWIGYTSEKTGHCILALGRVRVTDYDELKWILIPLAESKLPFGMLW